MRSALDDSLRDVEQESQKLNAEKPSLIVKEMPLARQVIRKFRWIEQRGKQEYHRAIAGDEEELLDGPFFQAVPPEHAEPDSQHIDDHVYGPQHVGPPHQHAPALMDQLGEAAHEMGERQRQNDGN